MGLRAAVPHVMWGASAAAREALQGSEISLSGAPSLPSLAPSPLPAAATPPTSTFTLTPRVRIYRAQPGWTGSVRCESDAVVVAACAQVAVGRLQDERAR